MGNRWRVARSAACATLVAALSIAFEVAPALGHAQARSAARVTVVRVTLGKPTEYAITVSTHSAAAGKVTFKVTNRGTLTNDFKVCTRATTAAGYLNSCVGRGTGPLQPGGSKTITLTLTRGLHEFLCAVPGHAVAGMKGVIGVGVKGPAATAEVANG